jgi:glutathione S-transferase
MRLFDSSIPSGNAYKVHLLLQQLGHRYETVELDILATPSETRRPEFLAKNPNGRIPVLELDDGSYLPESNAILFYLAEGTRYLPDDRRARAEVLSWMFFEQYSHEPFVATLKFFTYWGDLSQQPESQIARWKQGGQAAIALMGQHLATRDFFVGGRYSIADIALFAYTQSAAAVGFDVPSAVERWLDRVRGEPGWVRMKADPTGRSPG